MPSLLQRHRSDFRRRRGFTLIELAIAVAICVIVLAQAVPSFLNQVRRARRADAVDAVVAVLQAQERYRANNASYASALAAISVGASTTSGYYTIALSAVSAAGYTVTATAAGGTSQAGDSGCTTLTVAVTNGNPGYSPAACWSR